jgi:cytochrome P450
VTEGRDPVGALLRLATREGDVARYRGGPEPAYLVSRPEYIKHVLADNHANYSKETFINSMFKAAVADGLLTSEGAPWRRQRRLMQPAFHWERLVALAGAMTDSTLAMLARWQPAVDAGEPLDIAAEMGSLTLRITGQILFGVDIAEDMDRIGKEIADGLRSVVNPQKAHFQAGMKQLHALVNDIIARCRAAPDTPSVVSLLMEARDEESGRTMDDVELRDEVVTLLLAGHETTANSLSWTWYLLAQHPGAAAALRSEVHQTLDGVAPGINDLPLLPYTRMVMEESLRLYPPAWILGRKALGPDRLGEHEIPVGSTVAISPYVVHRLPRYWERPLEFDPLRFSPERSARRAPYTYLPFGGGPRLCIGHNLAMIEAQLILATIAGRYDLRLPPGHVVEAERLFVLRPRGGLPMLVVPVGTN